MATNPRISLGRISPIPQKISCKPGSESYTNRPEFLSAPVLAAFKNCTFFRPGSYQAGTQNFTRHRGSSALLNDQPRR